MNTILKRLQRLSEDELCAISEAIDGELERRGELTGNLPESARRRAVQRERSYRHRTGSSAIPLRMADVGKARRRRRAA